MNTGAGAATRLADAQACRDLVLATAACIDADDPAGLAACFTEHGSLVRPGGEPLQGRAAIQASYAVRPADRLTVHLICGTRLSSRGADETGAISRVLLWTGDAGAEAGPMGRPAALRQAVGEFDDMIVRTAEGWRIAQRVARFLLYREA